MMSRALKGNQGFTLLEIIVVLAVVALLAAALTPMILTYLEDAKKAQAQNDVNQIAAAITAFIKDTKVPPYKASDSTDKTNPIREATKDFTCLFTDEGTGPTTTTDETTNDTWTSSGAGRVECTAEAADKADSLVNQLITNGSSYLTTGRNRWQGPYLPTVKMDPWGNKYLVNIGNANPATGKVVLVLSPGPDNKIQTFGDTAKETVVEPQGDDIIARVK